MPAPSLYVYVALYIRLSVEDNKKRGCSVENQKLVLNDFLADKPDFVVYDTYIDNGLTGTNFHRPGFQQMLSDIEAGHINCVIVKDLSRLGRNSIDTASAYTAGAGASAHTALVHTVSNFRAVGHLWQVNRILLPAYKATRLVRHPAPGWLRIYG